MDAATPNRLHESAREVRGRPVQAFTRRRLLQAAGATGLGLLGWAAWKRAPRLDVEAVAPGESPADPAVADLRLVNDTFYTFEFAAFTRMREIFGGPALLGLYLRDGVLMSSSHPEIFVGQPSVYALLHPGQGFSFQVPLEGTGPQRIGATVYLVLPEPPKFSHWLPRGPARRAQEAAAAEALGEDASPPEAGPANLPITLWSSPIFPDGIVRPVPPISTLTRPVESSDFDDG